MSGTEGTVALMHKEAVNESDRVAAWRMDVAVRQGADPEVASRVATEQSIDLHEWISLVDRGCPPNTAYEILAPV